VALAQTGERLVVERPDLGLACGRSVIGFGRRAPPSREADTPLVSQAPAPVSNQGEATDHGELRRISLPETVWKVRMGPFWAPKGLPNGAKRRLSSTFCATKPAPTHPSGYFPDSLSSHVDEQGQRGGPKTSRPSSAIGPPLSGKKWASRLPSKARRCRSRLPRLQEPYPGSIRSPLACPSGSSTRSPCKPGGDPRTTPTAPRWCSR
jgi:hypothetical protein